MTKAPPKSRRRPSEAIDEVVDRLCASRKYRAVHPDTVRDIVVRQVESARDPADLERLARLRLHRAVALYLSSPSPATLLAELRAGALEGRSDSDTRKWCVRAMATHVSTLERLDDLGVFYPTLLDLTGPIGSVADVACALNVLSLPWLRDRSAVGYVAYDFNMDIVELGRCFAEIVDPTARVTHADVLVRPEVVAEDAALLLKTYHCLEARERGAGLRLIESIGARVVVVSLPTRSRGGRTLGFGAGYGDPLKRRADELGWVIRSARLPSEELWAIFKEAADVPER